MKNLKLLFLIVLMMLFTSIAVMAGQVTLRWDANDPAPEGYKVFAKEEGKAYTYGTPSWAGPETTTTLELPEGKQYHFIVRAFEGVLESEDSDEVSYVMPSTGMDKVKGVNVTRVVIININ